MSEKNRKKINLKTVLIKVLIIGFAAEFLFSGYMFLRTSKDNQANISYNKRVSQSITLTDDTPSISMGVSNASPIKVDFDTVKQDAKDCVAWVYCYKTNVDYPVVQGKDNNYYVRRLPNGNYNREGCIFIDYRNSSDFSDPITFVYGHNTNKDNMFTILTKYTEQSFYDSHPIWYIVTEEKSYKVELLAGFVVPYSSSFYKVVNKPDLLETELEKGIKKTRFASQFERNEELNLVAFSTCSWEFENARFVLLGQLVEIENAK